MTKTYKIVFPFTGQVKTQLKITTSKDGSKRLYKPANVKQFENAVRTILSCAFPFEMRPFKGYFRFDMHHYSLYKRNAEGIIEPKKISDLDNVFKTIADCFEPIRANQLKYDENGKPELTKTGKHATTKVIVTPGVIENDKYIMKEHLHWIPVSDKKEERLEIFITQLTEEELFQPPSLPYEIVDMTP